LHDELNLPLCCWHIFFPFEAPPADAAVASAALKDVCFSSFGCNGVQFVDLIQSDGAQTAGTQPCMVCFCAASGRDHGVNSQVTLLVAAQGSWYFRSFDAGEVQGKLPFRIGKQLLSAAKTTPQGWRWQ